MKHSLMSRFKSRFLSFTASLAATLAIGGAFAANAAETAIAIPTTQAQGASKSGNSIIDNDFSGAADILNLTAGGNYGQGNNNSNISGFPANGEGTVSGNETDGYAVKMWSRTGEKSGEEPEPETDPTMVDHDFTTWSAFPDGWTTGNCGGNNPTVSVNNGIKVPGWSRGFANSTFADDGIDLDEDGAIYTITYDMKSTGGGGNFAHVLAFARNDYSLAIGNSYNGNCPNSGSPQYSGKSLFAGYKAGDVFVGGDGNAYNSFQNGKITIGSVLQDTYFTSAGTWTIKAVLSTSATGSDVMVVSINGNPCTNTYSFEGTGKLTKYGFILDSSFVSIKNLKVTKITIKTADYEISGDATWSKTSLSGAAWVNSTKTAKKNANITVAADAATITVVGSADADKVVAGDVNVAGAGKALALAGDALTILNGAVTVGAGATLDINNTVVFEGDGSIGGEGTIDLAGATIKVASGTLTISKALAASAASIIVEEGATLDFGTIDSALTLANLSGAGTIKAASSLTTHEATVDLSGSPGFTGTVDFAGNFNARKTSAGSHTDLKNATRLVLSKNSGNVGSMWSGEAATIAQEVFFKTDYGIEGGNPITIAGAVSNNSGTTLSVSSGTVKLTGAGSHLAGNLENWGTLVIGDGANAASITIDGNASMSKWAQGKGAKKYLQILANAEVTVKGDLTDDSNLDLTNNGVLTINGSMMVKTNGGDYSKDKLMGSGVTTAKKLLLGNYATKLSLDGGTLILGSDGMARESDSASVRINDGMVVGASANWAAALPVEIAGTVTFNTGKFDLSGRTFSETEGATITVNGAVNWNGSFGVTGAGTLALAGGANLTGTATVAAGATLDLAGTVTLANAVRNGGTVNVSKKPTFELSGLGGAEAFYFVVIDNAGGGAVSGWGDLTAANFTINGAAIDPTLNIDLTTPGVLQIVKAGNLTWSGAADGNWDEATANWTCGGEATTFTSDPATNVFFVGAGAGTVTLCGDYSVNTMAVVAPGAAYTLTGDHTLTGGKLTVSGGTLTQGAGAEDAVKLNFGEIEVAAGATFVRNCAGETAGAVTLAGGAFQIAGAGAAGVTVAGINATKASTVGNTSGAEVKVSALTGGGDVTFTGGKFVIADAGEHTGAMTAGAGATVEVTVGAGETKTITVAAGAGDIIKNGEGTLIINPADSWAGKVIINEGAVDVNGKQDTSFKTVLNGGSIVNNGAAIGEGKAQMKGGIEVTKDSGVVAGNTFGVIGQSYSDTAVDMGGKSVTKTGNGDWMLFNTTFANGGSLNIQKGKLYFAKGTELGTTGVTIADGASFWLADAISGSGLVAFEKYTGDNSFSGAFSNSTEWAGTVSLTNPDRSGAMGESARFRNGTASTIRLKGIKGWFNGLNTNEVANIELMDHLDSAGVSHYAWTVGASGGGEDSTLTFTGRLTGSGTFFGKVNGGSESFKFAGDLSNFTGTFRGNLMGESTLPTGARNKLLLGAGDETGEITLGAFTIHWGDRHSAGARYGGEDNKVYINYGAADVVFPGKIESAMIVKQGSGTLTILNPQNHHGSSSNDPSETGIGEAMLIEAGTVKAMAETSCGKGAVTVKSGATLDIWYDADEKGEFKLSAGKFTFESGAGLKVHGVDVTFGEEGQTASCRIVDRGDAGCYLVPNGNVANFGETGYESIQAAIDAAGPDRLGEIVINNPYATAPSGYYLYTDGEGKTRVGAIQQVWAIAGTTAFTAGTKVLDVDGNEIALGYGQTLNITNTFDAAVSFDDDYVETVVIDLPNPEDTLEVVSAGGVAIGEKTKRVTILSGTMVLVGENESTVPEVRDTEFVFGADGSLDSVGPVAFNGEVVLNTDYETSILTENAAEGTTPIIKGTGAIIKKGSGTLTLNAVPADNANFTSLDIDIDGGELIFTAFDFEVDPGHSIGTKEINMTAGTKMSFKVPAGETATIPNRITGENVVIRNIDEGTARLEGNSPFTGEIRAEKGELYNVYYFVPGQQSQQSMRKIAVREGATLHFTAQQNLWNFAVSEEEGDTAGTLLLDGGVDYTAVKDSKYTGTTINIAKDTEMYVYKHIIFDGVTITGEGEFNLQTVRAADVGPTEIVGDGETLIETKITGMGEIIMNGEGTLTLTKANTYTGGTTVNSGTVAINNENALGNSGQITIKKGAVLDILEFNPNANDFRLVKGVAGRSVTIPTQSENWGDEFVASVKVNGTWAIAETKGDGSLYLKTYLINVGEGDVVPAGSSNEIVSVVYVSPTNDAHAVKNIYFLDKYMELREVVNTKGESIVKHYLKDDATTWPKVKSMNVPTGVGFGLDPVIPGLWYEVISHDTTSFEEKDWTAYGVPTRAIYDGEPMTLTAGDESLPENPDPERVVRYYKVRVKIVYDDRYIDYDPAAIK